MEKATIYDYARMCKANICGDCPLRDERHTMCFDTVMNNIDKANEIILKWCEEHPVETRQDRFLKMFPKAKVGNNGILDIATCNIDKSEFLNTYRPCSVAHGFNSCEECRKKYWLAEVDENE